MDQRQFRFQWDVAMIGELTGKKVGFMVSWAAERSLFSGQEHVATVRQAKLQRSSCCVSPAFCSAYGSLFVIRHCNAAQVAFNGKDCELLKDNCRLPLPPYPFGPSNSAHHGCVDGHHLVIDIHILMRRRYATVLHCHDGKQGA